MDLINVPKIVISCEQVGMNKHTAVVLKFSRVARYQQVRSRVQRSFLQRQAGYIKFCNNS